MVASDSTQLGAVALALMRRLWQEEGAISFRAILESVKPRNVILGVLPALLVVSSVIALPARAAQSPADATGPVQAAASPQLFATLSALYAVGLDAGRTSEDADPSFAEVRSQLLAVRGPATDALRQYYRDHILSDPAATMSRYITFALVAGPPPKFALPPNRMDLPPDVLDLDGFSEILANFYQEAQIEQLWRQVQPVYEGDVLLLREPLGSIVLSGMGYLRQLVRAGTGTFTAYAEPFVGGQTQFRNAGDQYTVVVDPKLNPSNSFDAMRHAFLHFLLDPLPIRYQEQITVDRPLFLIGAGAPRMPVEFRDDYSAFFTECLVRAVELRVQRLPPDQLAQELNRAEGDGFVLDTPTAGRAGEIRSFRAAHEPVLPGPDSFDRRNQRANASVCRPLHSPRRPTIRRPPTLISVTMGMRRRTPFPRWMRRSAKERGKSLRKMRQPRGPRLKRALSMQPGQPRALYGLAVASLLQGDAERARGLFEQVVTGASSTGGAAAHSDPVALAWSHVYLGRMHDLDGDRDQALADYRAALAVSGVPEEARSAAQHGIQQSYQLAAPSKSPG